MIPGVVITGGKKQSGAEKTGYGGYPPGKDAAIDWMRKNIGTNANGTTKTDLV